MLKLFVGQSDRMFPSCIIAKLMLFTICVSTAQALDIVWISQNSNDVSFVTALENAGHNVSWQIQRYESLTGDEITELNASDLVIVGRNTSSGNFIDGTEIADWNGLNTRLMLCNGYIVRNNRWNWLDSDTTTASFGQIVVDADDQAYAGLGVSNGESTDISSLSIDSSASTDVGNGTLISENDGSSAYVMMARWAAGTEFYPGSGATAAAERVYFPIGDNYSYLTDFGKSVFYNLIDTDKEWIAKINFQSSSAATPAGYLPDSGQIFGSRGNGLVYGWNENNTGTARERNAHYDQRFDTLVHMYNPNDFTLRTWEIALPNGVYYVDLLMGDPSFDSLTNNVEVEGVVLTDPTPGTSLFDNYQNVAVTVTDGRLTVAPNGYGHQKILSIKIVPGSDYTVDPDDYTRSATITFDGYTGSTPLTNFPMLIRLNPSTPVAGWYGLADANGYDVQFADADGNLLPHEFELWNPGSESVVWVKVPLIDSPEDYIVMYWGRNGQSDLDFWPINVWSEGYAAVLHLGETSGTHYDSIGDHDSSDESVVTQDASGMIDGADYFTGASDCNITVPYSIDLEEAVKYDCTVSIWAYSEVAASSIPSYDMAYMCDFGTSHGQGVGLLFNKSHAAFNNGKISAYYNSCMLGETTGEADTWYYVTLTHEGTNLVLYVNGAVDSATSASVMYLYDAPLRIGGEGKNTTGRTWQGVLDEPRISSVARSADWIRNEYNSQISASAYCSFDVATTGTVILVR